MLRPQQGLRRASAARPDLLREAFARSVIRGLGDEPRWLSCRYLYDHVGSEIFERITEQPEYYPTRTEAGILERNAARLRDRCASGTIVELGAGSATKTRLLLRAWTDGGRPARYVPVDISRTMLASACASLRREFRSLVVDGLAGSYEHALPRIARFSPLVLVFLGSSIGNFNDEELEEFLGLLASSLAGGDRLLLGLDLVKDTATLEAAYNDAAGWSAAFTLNLFARMNRELGTTVRLEDLEHVARWNAGRSCIEIFARFRRDAVIALPEWKREFRLHAGEMVLVEISRKFRAGDMGVAAARHGLVLAGTMTDAAGFFALQLYERHAASGAPGDSRRSRLRDELAAQRERTLAIVAPLDDAQLTRQHCPILSPVVWDLGHIAGYEREWVARATGDSAWGSAHPAVARLYDPIAHPRAVRGRLALAGPEDCREALSAARADTLRLLDRAQLDSDDPLLHDGYVFSMIAQHEAQHAETILQAIQLLPSLRYEPGRRLDPAPAIAHAEGETFVAGGPFLMGSDDRCAAYDNERPAHVVELESFWIDVAPVTNATWLEFLDDGGYRRRELWTADGWAWLRESGCSHPAHWVRDGDGAWRERWFGRTTELACDRPVSHVCWYEAQACASWLGKRLPTEAEWEKAAAWDLERAVPRRYPWGDAEPDDERANLDQRTFAPSAAGAYPRGQSYYGCHQMLGDVWEWTASDFLPYPGFRAFPYAEYSQVHFGPRHKVLRGGSWATPRIAIRNTFRNWDLPQRRQIFAGLRCARD